MGKIILTLSLVSLFWIQNSDGLKCYKQTCNRYYDKYEFQCIAPGEGWEREAKPNRICKEQLIHDKKGVIEKYERWDEYVDDKWKAKYTDGEEACYGNKETKDRTCFCKTDFCNKKHFKLPEGKERYEYGDPKHQV